MSTLEFLDSSVTASDISGAIPRCTILRKRRVISHYTEREPPILSLLRPRPYRPFPPNQTTIQTMGLPAKRMAGQVLGALHLSLNLLHHHYRTSPILVLTRVSNVEVHRTPESHLSTMGDNQLAPGLTTVKRKAKVVLPAVLTPPSSKSSTQDLADRARKEAKTVAIEEVSTIFERTLW